MTFVIRYRNFRGDDRQLGEFVRRTAGLTSAEARRYLSLEDGDECTGYWFVHPGEVAADHALVVTTLEHDAHHPWEHAEGRGGVERAIRYLRAEGLLSPETEKRLLALLEGAERARWR